MTLHLPGQTVGIAQMGPDFLILDHPLSHPPCNAGVTVMVDDSTRHWEVALPQGIHPEVVRVVVALPVAASAASTPCAG